MESLHLGMVKRWVMQAAVLSLPPYHSFFFTFPLHGSNGHPPPIKDYLIGLTQQMRQVFHCGTYCKLFFQSPQQGRQWAWAKIDFVCKDLLPVEDCHIGLTQQTRQKHHCSTCCNLFFLSPLQGRWRARAKFEFRFTQCLQIADIAFCRYLVVVEEYLISLTQQMRQEFHHGTYCVLFSLSPPQGRWPRFTQCWALCHFQCLCLRILVAWGRTLCLPVPTLHHLFRSMTKKCKPWRDVFVHSNLRMHTCWARSARSCEWSQCTKMTCYIQWLFSGFIAWEVRDELFNGSLP